MSDLPPVTDTCCPVVELRQYVMQPGQRDALITLFERYFIEGQEEHPMRILGQFRNRAEPDRFVWLRGFADMETRRAALEGFYGGPVWQAHHVDANATMIDASDVLLLKPAGPGDAFELAHASRPGPDAAESDGGLVTATIYRLKAPAESGFTTLFDAEVAPVLQRSGVRLLGRFVTEPAPNTYPRLPVREGEHVFVWLASFSDDGAYLASRQRLCADESWQRSIAPILEQHLSGAADVLELTPTRRSWIRHRPKR